MSGSRRILVTGGTGYIGQELMKALMQTEKRNHLALISRDRKRAQTLYPEGVFHIGGERDEMKEGIATFSPDIVVHLSAYSSSMDTPEEMRKLIESNILFTASLLEALSECSIKLFVNTGSFSEYHDNDNILNPTYFYSATKTSARYLIEYFSKKKAFTLVNAILYSVYGKAGTRKKIVDFALDALEADKPIAMSEGKQILDFVHVDDVVKFYLQLIEHHETLNITQKEYHIGTGRGTSIRELVSLMEEITHREASVQWGSNQIRKVDTVQAVASIVKAREELHWSARIDLRTGLMKYIDCIAEKKKNV